MQPLLEAQAERRQLPLAEWHEVVSFASDQCARWQVRWLFSPAARPDAAAAAEFDGWRAIYAACAEALLTRVPEVRARVERHHEMTALKHALRRRLNETEGRSARRIGLALLSQTSGIARRLGLHAVARWLDQAALYPPGSVGRTPPSAA
ncbi:hypothetical protein BH23ACI1_BH23ACI1_02640 [soil metagenome]